MNVFSLLSKAENLIPLSSEEGEFLFLNADLQDLIFVANYLRLIHKPVADRNKVGWIIDRNINLSNICVTQCKFCNFCRKKSDSDAYVTSIDEYRIKIEELFACGGNQILLQGGMNPDLGLDFYAGLFSLLKKEFPRLVLHALGPAEIVYLSNKSNKSYKEVLEILHNSGLDSLPGAGAEILSDRVRKLVSPAKCSVDQWLEVMHQAHILNLPTSATMMLGHVETIAERMQHLVRLRETQSQKPDYSQGFVTFIPWPFCSEGTKLNKNYGPFSPVSGVEYLRMIALCRIMLTNIDNIQASWLTVGKNIGQICLHAGANDFGSIMMEEHVVSAAGANYSLDIEGMTKAISQAGFVPVKRNSKYEFIE